MNVYQQAYYKRMLEKDRLVPIMIGGHLAGFITYYIGSLAEKYVRDDPWSVVDDDPEHGTICFVDQMITNKAKGNYRYSRAVWKYFREHISKTYPRVRAIRWNRVKQGVPYVFYHTITPKRAV